jgi:hypothetical protein
MSPLDLVQLAKLVELTSGRVVVEKFFTRVDVTEEFPFLVTKISPYN